MTAGNRIASAALVRAPQPTRVIRLTGRLTYGPACEERYRELCRVIQKGFRRVIFDLSAVPDIDSAGIGFLVGCLTTLRLSGGTLCLAAPSGRVLRALLITNLERVFPVAESAEAAMQSGV